jgi:uncharacterized lipoprotein
MTKLNPIVGLIGVLLLSGCSAWENAYEQASATSFKVDSIKGLGALDMDALLINWQ